MVPQALLIFIDLCCLPPGRLGGVECRRVGARLGFEAMQDGGPFQVLGLDVVRLQGGKEVARAIWNDTEDRIRRDLPREVRGR